MKTKRFLIYSSIYLFFGIAFVVGLLWHLIASLEAGQWIYGLHWTGHEPETAVAAQVKLTGVFVLSIVSLGFLRHHLKKYRSCE